MSAVVRVWGAIVSTIGSASEFFVDDFFSLEVEKWRTFHAWDAGITRSYLPHVQQPSLRAYSDTNANHNAAGEILTSILSGGTEQVRSRIALAHHRTTRLQQHVVAAWLPMYAVTYTDSANSSSEVHAADLEGLVRPYIIIMLLPDDVIGGDTMYDDDEDRSDLQPRAYRRKAVLRVLRFLEYDAYLCVPELKGDFFVDDDSFVQVHNVAKLVEDMGKYVQYVNSRVLRLYGQSTTFSGRYVICSKGRIPFVPFTTRCDR